MTARWRLARLLDRLTGWCWADLGTWAEWRKPWRELPSARDRTVCISDQARNGVCWCGKYRDGADL